MVRKRTEDGDKVTSSFRSNRVMTLMIAAAVIAVGCFILIATSDEAEAVDLGSCGTNLTCSYDADTKTLTISGSGTEISNYSSSDPPWSGYKGTMETVIIGDSVTTIGKKAFFECTSLKTVEMNNVTSIRDYAFYGCSSLTTIDLSKATSIGNYSFSRCTSLENADLSVATQINNGLFEGCTALKEVQMPQVTHIYQWAFKKCSSLTDVYLPSLTNVGNDAFWGCSSLTYVNLSNVISIGKNTFRECSSLDGVDLSKVTLIDTNAFEKCSSLTNVDLSSVETINASAFIGCKSLTVSNLPSATGIGNYAFQECSSLKSLSAPNAKTIGNNAFYECSSLTELSIPAVTSIGTKPFYGCASLKSIDIGSSPNFMIENGILYNSAKTTLIRYLGGDGSTDFTVPSTVTTINDGAFAGWNNLTSIIIDGSTLDHYCSVDGVLYNKSMTELIHYPAGKTGESFIIPESVTTINPQAFLDCENLTSIEVEAGNTKFSSKYGCLFNFEGTKLIVCPAGIESFTLESDVKSVGSKAFSGTKLKKLSVSANSVIHFETDSFYDCDNLDKITLHENVDLSFGHQSIRHLQTDEKTILVIAHIHDCIPQSALSGNVKVAYGSHPSNSGGGSASNSTDDNMEPVVPVNPSEPSNPIIPTDPEELLKDQKFLLVVLLVAAIVAPVIMASVMFRKV